VSIAGRQGDADAYADHEVMSVQVVGPAQHLDNLVRERNRTTWLIGADLNDCELIAAEPGNGIGRIDAVAQPVCNCGQKSVPHGMAERVIDALEMIEIKAHHGRGAFR
jgi:hypothetical protein